MTKEQTAFIQILSDHLNKRKTEKVDKLDWGILLDYARIHQVSGIIYSQAKMLIPAEIRDAFRQDTIVAYCHYENRNAVCCLIKQKLDVAEIPFFIIKGPVVAEQYPCPELRVMGDIDIVVHPENRNRVHELFIEEGFFCKTKEEDREWQYVYHDMEIELHDRLVYQENVNEEGQEQYFNKCWDHVTDGRLEWNFHLLFLIFHLRKHLMNSGAGFRQFMDLAVTVNNPQTNWSWLKQNLSSTGMMLFAQRCFGFLDRWFGVVSPIMEEPDDAFYETATIKVFADGIFGFDNEENDDSAVINHIRHKKRPGWEMLRTAMRKLFPDINVMKNMEQYNYVKRCPLLLPIAWIHRMVKERNKDEGIKGIMKQSFTSKESVKRRDDLLKKWGL